MDPKLTIHNTAFHEISNSTVAPALLWLGLLCCHFFFFSFSQGTSARLPPNSCTIITGCTHRLHPRLRCASRLLQSTSNDSSSKTVRSRCRPVPPREDSPPLLSCSGGLRPPQVRTTSSLLAALRPLSSSSSVSFVSWTSENPIMHAHEANEATQRERKSSSARNVTMFVRKYCTNKHCWKLFEKSRREEYLL